jgi:imidazolonepropionase-like amidohydrolase
MIAKLVVTATVLSLVATVPLKGQDAAAAPHVTLFQNVRIFDGKSDKLTALSNVLVRSNRIEKVSSDPIPIDRRGDTMIIDGSGKTLMPGLIDNHVHLFMAGSSPPLRRSSS